jgi:RAB protein geranylgeranyltransferase component A
MDLPLDETNYDVIVLGSGFTESVIAGALARTGKRVLHLDKNDFYGGYMSGYNLASLNSALRAPPPQYEANSNPSQVNVSDSVGPIFHNVKIYQTDDEHEAESTQAAINDQDPTHAAPQAAATVEQVSATLVAPQESAATQETASQESQESQETAPDAQTVQDAPAAQDAPAVPAQDALDEPIEVHEELATSVPFSKLLEESRHYSIDLIPRMLFCRGPMVNLLISSAVGRYLEFKCFEKSFLYTADSLQPVPCSKADIFKSNFITNSERRMLARFLQLIQSDMEQPGQIARDAYPSLYDFVKAQKLSPKLEEFILYSISLASADQTDPQQQVGCDSGLTTLQTYIASVDKYGSTPYLYPLYGCSEMPQAFCRLAAVYGAVYVLRRTAKQLLLDPQTREFRGVVCSEGQTLNAQHIVTSSEYLPQLVDSSSVLRKSSRCIAVTNKRLGSGDAGLSFVVIPPNSPVGNKNAIHVLQFDYSLFATPKKKYLLHFITETSKTAEEDLCAAVSLLLSIPGEEAAESSSSVRKPSALWRAYFELWVHQHSSHTQPSYPPNVHIVNAGPIDTGVDVGEALAEAERVFRSISPNEEFLPKVPNPEDIIWSEEAVEAEGTTGG